MTKILWLDLEMTGLDVDKEVIIEVAGQVTDLNLKVLDTYHTVVNQPQIYLDNMDDWNQTHHRESGLIDLIPSGKEPQVVENELIEWTEKNFGDEKAILAGNSIGQDRLFLNRYMPDFTELLHYRMLDVSSWKLVFNHMYQQQYQKKTAHRALDDIRESIEELKFYLQFLKI